MNNPFEPISKKLNNIEGLLIDLLHKPTEDLSTKRYSVKEAAELLGVIPLTIRNHIKKGNIKAQKIGRKYYISHNQLFNDSKEVKSLKYKR